MGQSLKNGQNNMYRSHFGLSAWFLVQTQLVIENRKKYLKGCNLIIEGAMAETNFFTRNRTDLLKGFHCLTFEKL